jgi:hypothetical protein
VFFKYTSVCLWLNGWHLYPGCCRNVTSKSKCKWNRIRWPRPLLGFRVLIRVGPALALFCCIIMTITEMESVRAEWNVGHVNFVIFRGEIMKFHLLRQFHSLSNWLLLERRGALCECWRHAFLYQNGTHAFCLLFEILKQYFHDSDEICSKVTSCGNALLLNPSKSLQ